MKIKLIKIKEKDLGRILEWRTKSSVTKYMLTDPILTMENQKKWFQEIQKNENKIYWIIEVDSVKIGIYSIDKIENTCELGYYIGEDKYRRKGIMKNLEEVICDYAFKILGAKRIYNKILSNNIPAIEMHKKGNFKLQKIEEKIVYKNHIWFDIFIFVREKENSIEKKYSIEKGEILYEI